MQACKSQFLSIIVRKILHIHCGVNNSSTLPQFEKFGMAEWRSLFTDKILPSYDVVHSSLMLTLWEPSHKGFISIQSSIKATFS